VPLTLTETEGAVLVMVSCPLEAAVEAGSNCTVNTAAWPGFKVAGKLPPETENPVPLIASALMVTAAVPLEVTVTDLVTAVPTATLPNDNEAALRLKDAV
jgi:hypothetical protein